MHREALQTAVQRLKYAQRVSLAAPLGELLATQLAARDWQPTLLVPVPMHRGRRTLRGYNQAELLAEEVARQSGLPVAPGAIRCIRAVGSQVGQPRAVRVRNVHNAFVLTDPARIRTQRVVLLDDVWTTGSTLAECARVLREGGAAEVFALTVTHAPPPGSTP
jgi:ComF family protein